MGRSYNTAKAFPVGRSLFIATASYEAVKPGYAYSLALTTAELARQGIPFEIAIMEGNCHVDDGRNDLVRDFLNGNCTDMLFLDSDLMWNPSEVVKIMLHDDELVCGAYPKKCYPERYPIGQIFNAHENGLLEVSYAPTGFMRIRRSVFEKLLPSQSTHGAANPTAVFFERKFNGNSRDGGDVTFCRKWIAIGGKVMVDATLTLAHVGENNWTGKFIDFLAKEENQNLHVDLTESVPVTHNTENYVPVGEPVSFWLERLKEGNDSPEVFEELVRAYGNEPWSATPELLREAYRMAKGKTSILECGSGLTTAVLAVAGAKVVAVEEEGAWAEKTDALLRECGLDAQILVCPVKGQWFTDTGAINEAAQMADMVLIDGPRRREGLNRMYPFDAGFFAPGTAVVADDVSEISHKGEWTANTESRPFVTGKLG